MKSDESYMLRCLELAQEGFGEVQPNPMVGAVVMKDDRIIGEGYHERFGGPHAEVQALRSVLEPEKIRGATIYVNLEPCSHSGKTPPCADLLIESGVGKVVVGEIDPNPAVAGNGIKRLKEAGIEVIIGILSKECCELNKRFYTFHQKKRPYIILKWAQTQDGFIAREDYSSRWISSHASRKLVHQWRASEMAIMVGTTTALHDNPQLTVREVEGKNPTRVLIDKSQQIPTSFHIFDESAKTILFNAVEDYEYPAAELVKIDFQGDVLAQILSYLQSKDIQSLIVEGGAKLLSSFISRKLWDEARVFVSPKIFETGIKAPIIGLKHGQEVENGEGDKIFVIRNLGSS